MTFEVPLISCDDVQPTCAGPSVALDATGPFHETQDSPNTEPYLSFQSPNSSTFLSSGDFDVCDRTDRIVTHVAMVSHAGSAGRANTAACLKNA